MVNRFVCLQMQELTSAIVKTIELLPGKHQPVQLHNAIKSIRVPTKSPPLQAMVSQLTTLHLMSH
uniref:Uncharacterized protein n=1 Tax=Arion vulgaris TaxID=1028688 RepID=A0A0B7BHV1_9EUPU